MRVHIVSLGFAPARVFLACMDQVYKTIGLKDFNHILLNNHYPVDKARNDFLIEQICRSYGIKFHDVGENIGLAAGYNLLLNNLRFADKADDEDIVIGIDPDVWPISKGWGQALIDVMSGDPAVAWASLWINSATERETTERGYTPNIINGVKVRELKQASMNSICAWRLGVLRELGGLEEPKKYYGGVEGQMFPKMVERGLKWVFLEDFKEECSPLVNSEDLYRVYKWEYAHKNSTQLDFESWLKARGEL